MAAEHAPATGHRRGLMHHWLHRTALSWVLWPVSALYGLLMRVRRSLYSWGLLHSHRLPVPVLVVGNVVAGGAGKTPTVIGLVQHLRQAGWQPGVVSRGHGRQSAECLEVTLHSRSAEVGDEPCLIHQATHAPMVVGRQRVAAGRALLQRHPHVNIIVCDDGMQHWPLQRDVTVVVFDDRGTGNGFLLPAGLLREPWPTPPWGTGQMLVLHTAPSASLPLALPGTPHFQAQRQLSVNAINSQGQPTPLCQLVQQTQAPNARPLAALAGIARPDKFFDMLQQAGVPLQHSVALPDHADSATLLAALSPHYTWLCTAKDAIKLFPALAQHPSSIALFAVPLEQTPEPAFYVAVDSALKGLSSAHGHQTP